MNLYSIFTQIATLNFCYFATSQQMNIRLLRTEYYEYVNVYYELKRKCPDYKAYMDGDEYNRLSEKSKEYIKIYTKKQERIRDRLIKNCEIYCENYPNEKMASNRFLKEYEAYPYRLHQNMDTLIEDL